MAVCGLLAILAAALWRLGDSNNKSKELYRRWQRTKNPLTRSKGEISTIKEDISDIKDGVDRQGHDMAAVLGALQAMMIALNDEGCNITGGEGQV